MQTQTKAKEKAGHTPGQTQTGEGETGAQHTPGYAESAAICDAARVIAADLAERYNLNLVDAYNFILEGMEAARPFYAAKAELAETKAQRDEAVAALQNLVRCIERDNLHTTQGVKLAQARAAIAKVTEGQS